jgi:hypothetical protein
MQIELSDWSRRAVAMGCAGIVATVGMVASARASTVYNVTSSSTLESPSALCLEPASVCPGSSPSNPLNASAFMDGTFTYTAGAVPSVAGSTGSVSFSVTLTQNAFFGSEEFAEGTTFSASGVAVSGTATSFSEDLSQSPAATGFFSLVSPSLMPTETNPLISGLQCVIGSKSGTCGFTMGTGGGLQVQDSTGTYTGSLAFSASLTPVPIPATLPLLLSGLFGIALLARRQLALI